MKRVKRTRRTKAGSVRISKTYLALWLLILMLMGSLLIFGGAKALAGPEATEKYYTSIRVQAGDSLWSIAKAYAPEFSDIQAYVEELAQINQIRTSHQLRSGQSLIIVYYK